MGSTFHERGVGTILQRVLEDTSGETILVNPTSEAIAKLIEVMEEADTPPVRVLATDGTVKPVMEDFLVASAAADLIDDERLSLWVDVDVSSTMLLVTDEQVVAVVTAGDRVAGLTTDDEEFVENANERYEEALTESELFRLRTPPMSQIRESLDTELGSGVANDFESVLASMETARGEDGLDEVTISLLVAAKNEVLLYDVSKWGEDVGVASKATFSRTKTRLEERGLIDTEKVPIDVGRPRLRLLLGDERLQDASVDELAAIAQSLLSDSLQSSA